jgi:hypothetical protein
MHPERFRITSEGGVTALLGAAAGFFISQATFLKATTPLDGTRIGAYVALYCLLFAAIPLMFRSLKIEGPRKLVSLFASLGVIALAYHQLFSTLFTITGDGQGSGTWAWEDNYSIPIMTMPIVWLLAYSFDEINDLIRAQIGQDA